jgi:putative acetyltransferase
MDISFKIAETPEEFSEGAELFNQYARFVNIDLSFQNFAGELKTIHEQYNKPKGTLLLAYNEKKAIGCVALREWNNETAELKRMFVLEEYQGCKIGRRLLELVLAIAKELHYKKVRLDTLSTMNGALKLYRSYGFYEIPSYRYNPLEGPVYMEKQLE